MKSILSLLLLPFIFYGLFITIIAILIYCLLVLINNLLLLLLLLQ